MKALVRHGGGKTLEELTADATATAADILSGKTAYANGGKLTGTAQAAKTKVKSFYDSLNGKTSVSFDGTTVTVNDKTLGRTITIVLE